jgi:hypothetical protein
MHPRFTAHYQAVVDFALYTGCEKRGKICYQQPADELWSGFLCYYILA